MFLFSSDSSCRHQQSLLLSRSNKLIPSKNNGTIRCHVMEECSSGLTIGNLLEICTLEHVTSTKNLDIIIKTLLCSVTRVHKNMIPDIVYRFEFTNWLFCQYRTGQYSRQLQVHIMTIFSCSVQNIHNIPVSMQNCR